MSLLLVYHNAENLVVASDRRVVTRDASGERTPAGNGSPKFVVLKNNRVLAGLGRLDVVSRVFEGTERMLAEHPTLGFADLASIVPAALARTFERRSGPRETDGVCGVLCGYDSKLLRMRTISWHSDESFSPYERYDPVQNISAFGVVGVDTKDACNRLARDAEAAPLPARTPAFLAERLRTAVRAISKKNPKLVSPEAYFSAFNRYHAVALPPEFEPPIAALQGESRFMVGSIITPAAGGNDTVGNNDGGLGAQEGNENIIPFRAASAAGTGTCPNPTQAIDGIAGHSATVNITGAGGVQTETIHVSLSPFVAAKYSKVFLNYFMDFLGAGTCSFEVKVTAPAVHSFGVTAVSVGHFIFDTAFGTGVELTPYLNRFYDTSQIGLDFIFTTTNAAAKTIALSNVCLNLVG